MGRYAVHVCSFEACDLPRGRKLTYAAFTRAVLAAGRFSVFEATANQRVARMFTRMGKDSRFVFDTQTTGFPWTRVAKRKGKVPIFEYRCPNGHVREVIDLKKQYDGVASLICSICGQTAVKVATSASFGGFTEPKESNVSRAIRKVKERGLAK